ncbi:MAG TPA: GtrA family protein [Candidatus Limnocylindrales bacterium]|nr:GtrA family protein [Candidatus Limnocylindrales bacterium]
MSSAAASPTPGIRRHRRTRVNRLLGALLSPSKFAVVGVIGIVVNQVALYVLTDVVGIYYLMSAVLASLISTFNNFVLVELFVFRHRESRHRLLVRYVAFSAINLATLVIRVPMLYVLTDIAGIYYLASNLIAIGVTFGIRYLVADNWIWAGRDRRDQVAIEGVYQYDVHGIMRIQSDVRLPELAAFNVGVPVRPDIVIRRRWLGGGPRLRVRTWREGDVIRYREHFGLLSAAFDVRLPHGSGADTSATGPIELDANWLLCWSHHVLYTNMVEPLLRFILIARGHVLLHCAAVDGPNGAIVMSAQTDTGKTSTVLRLLMHHSWGFLSDDMAIVSPDGTLYGYPKPMTLSSHTMSAVNERRLPAADRFMLAIRSRVHSKQGRSIGHSMGRMNLPIVTINSWVQLFVPPPKYHIQSLIDCDVVDTAPVDTVVLMERGDPLTEEPSTELTLDRLLENTDDAYTFPPFASFAPEVVVDGMDHDTLRARERQILAAWLEPAWRLRLRVSGHSWSEVIPTLVDRHHGRLTEALEADEVEEPALVEVGSASAG